VVPNDPAELYEPADAKDVGVTFRMIHTDGMKCLDKVRQGEDHCGCAQSVQLTVCARASRHRAAPCSQRWLHVLVTVCAWTVRAQALHSGADLPPSVTHLLRGSCCCAQAAMLPKGGVASKGHQCTVTQVEETKAFVRIMPIFLWVLSGSQLLCPSLLATKQLAATSCAACTDLIACPGTPHEPLPEVIRTLPLQLRVHLPAGL
jgi:hypothetical protein